MHIEYQEHPVFQPNMIVDRMVRALSREEIQSGLCREVRVFNLKSATLRNWAEQDYQHAFPDYRHKKLIELFTTLSWLKPEAEHDFMDLAGGRFTYIGNLDCRRRVLQDRAIPDALKQRLQPAVECIESDVSALPLEAQSMDRICCHHSFEHFQADRDTRCIEEIQRLLRPGGKCCILPVFLADRCVELVDDFTFALHDDPEATYLVDPTAALPGGQDSGNFARIYDPASFQRRVLDAIDESHFNVTLLEIQVDGHPVPDLSLDMHAVVTAINYPYRALAIERKS